MTDVQVPAGTVLPFAGNISNLPDGWRYCDGSSVSKNDYPDLFNAIGTSFGGSGNPSFFLPDLRGMFLRGIDDGTGRDPDAANRYGQNNQGGNPGDAGDQVGSWQTDQFQTHGHAASTDALSVASQQKPNDGPDYCGRNSGTVTVSGPNSGNYGAETRPKNVYVYYIIKAKSATT